MGYVMLRAQNSKPITAAAASSQGSGKMLDLIVDAGAVPSDTKFTPQAGPTNFVEKPDVELD